MTYSKRGPGHLKNPFAHMTFEVLHKNGSKTSLFQLGCQHGPWKATAAQKSDQCAQEIWDNDMGSMIADAWGHHPRLSRLQKGPGPRLSVEFQPVRVDENSYAKNNSPQQ